MKMTAILGIDAAWTLKQPSGLALGISVGHRWRIARTAASYSDFLDLPSASNALPPLDTLLATSQLAAGQSIGLICVDMPLSVEPITSRREADNHRVGRDVTGGYIIVNSERLRGPVDQIASKIIQLATDP